jgi:hypothetical protein
MAEYLEDARTSDKPWENWQYQHEHNDDWHNATRELAFSSHYKYRRKPKTIIINGIEVPEPVRHRLDPKVEFYIPELNVEKLYVRSFWSNHAKDYIWLQRGIIHLTAEAAEIHAKALLSFTEK